MAAEDEGEDEELLKATFGVIILSESGVQLSLVKNKGYRDESLRNAFSSEFVNLLRRNIR